MINNINKTLKIKNNFKLKKSTINKLNKNCKLYTDNNFYIFSDIEDYDGFLYYISKEIVRYQTEHYLKKELHKYFDEEKVKIILNGYKNKTYCEVFYETLVKLKLFLYFKHNDTLNISAFYKFNLQHLFDEFDNIIDCEISADGNFLSDNNDNPDIKMMEEIFSKVIEGIIKIKETTKNNMKISGLHIFLENNKIKVVDEENKQITYENTCIYEKELDVLYENLKKVNIENKKDFILDKDILFIMILIGVYVPERIILYKSLSKDLLNNLLDNFELVKEKFQLKTECYFSEENIPVF